AERVAAAQPLRRPVVRPRPGTDGDKRSDAPECYPIEFAASREDRRALLVLAALRALTPRRLLALADRERTASACLAAVRGGRAGSDADQRFARAMDTDELLRALEACGARAVAFDEPEYPRGLDALKDPPAMLFIRGRDLREVYPVVAMVGARHCSPAGAEMAGDIAEPLARQ